MSDMNRVAVVTGGSRGIGLGISQALISQDFRVAVVATRPEPDGLVDALGGPDRAAYFQGRVDDVDAHTGLVSAIVAHFGRIDVLVNNAGVAPEERRDLLDATPESYDRVMGINLRGPYFLTQAVARQMLEQEAPNPTLRGVIVNVSSISATTVSINRGEYCLSKAGVSMATRLWAARSMPSEPSAWKPTWTERPVRSATARSSLNSANDAVGGFSSSTSAPCSRARMASSAWVPMGVAMLTTSAGCSDSACSRVE